MADETRGGLPDPETLLIIIIGAGVGAAIAFFGQKLALELGPKLRSPKPIQALFEFVNQRIGGGQA